jgi:hypothetical protein
LRDKDFDGHVVLFAAEEHLPYERPPLSKEYLAGKKGLGDCTTASSAWYRDHHIELQLGTEVSAIDPDTHTVSLPDGSAVSYDKLLLATGSQPRRPPILAQTPTGVLPAHRRRRRRAEFGTGRRLFPGRRRRRLDRPRGRRRSPRPRRQRHGRRNGGASADGGARPRGRRGVRRAPPRTRCGPSARCNRAGNHHRRRQSDRAHAGRRIDG